MPGQIPEAVKKQNNLEEHESAIQKAMEEYLATQQLQFASAGWVTSYITIMIRFDATGPQLNYCMRRCLKQWYYCSIYSDKQSQIMELSRTASSAWSVHDESDE